MSSDKKTKIYQRALPFRAPGKTGTSDEQPQEDAPARPSVGAQPPGRPASGNSRFVLRVGILCVILLSASGLALWYKLARDGENRHAGFDASTPVDGPKSDPETPATKPAKGTTPSVVLNPQAPPAFASGAAKKPVDSPAAAGAKERYLEALGSLTAAHLYQSFLNIGLLADAVESEQLEVGEARKTLANITRFMTLVDTQLDQVAKTDLDPNDLNALQNIRKQAGFLRAQSSALQAYWESGAARDVERFHEARKQAWTGICATLGVEGTEDAPTKPKGTKD
jgi:hypothetical protein